MVFVGLGHVDHIGLIDLGDAVLVLADEIQEPLFLCPRPRKARADRLGDYFNSVDGQRVALRPEYAAGLEEKNPVPKDRRDAPEPITVS